LYCLASRAWFRVLDPTILGSVPRLQIAPPAESISISAGIQHQKGIYRWGRVQNSKSIGQHRSASDLSTTEIQTLQKGVLEDSTAKKFLRKDLEKTGQLCGQCSKWRMYMGEGIKVPV